MIFKKMVFDNNFYKELSIIFGNKVFFYLFSEYMFAHIYIQKKIYINIYKK